MQQLVRLWNRIINRVTAQQIAAGLVIVGLITLTIGLINKHCVCANLPNLGTTFNDTIGDFYANVTVDCFSIAFAIFVLNRVSERRAEEQLKAQLIREMGSKDNETALRAVRELAGHGWLGDGSLKKANLHGANLRKLLIHSQNRSIAEINLDEAWLNQADFQRADLQYASFRGAFLRYSNFYGANLFSANLQDTYLQGANLRGASLISANLLGSKELKIKQMVEMFNLQFAIMPDGQRYDGRFNLFGDIANMKMPYFSDDKFWERQAYPEDPVSVAKFYGVSLDDYLRGQEWARTNLSGLRQEAGLDVDTGQPLQGSPSNSPQNSRRSRNLLNISMVAHRVRR